MKLSLLVGGDLISNQAYDNVCFGLALSDQHICTLVHTNNRVLSDFFFLCV